jgi:hypothetical protein
VYRYAVLQRYAAMAAREVSGLDEPFHVPNKGLERGRQIIKKREYDLPTPVRRWQSLAVPGSVPALG